MKTLKEIMYEYANTRGGGLPLTAEEICNSVVLWVQQYLKENIEINVEEVLRQINTIDPITGSIKGGKIEISLEKSTLEADFAEGNFISAYDLAERIKGSESIVVDVAEDGKSIEIHLDGDILAIINKAIVIPSTPTRPFVNSVPLFNSSNMGYVWQDIDIATTKLYMHRLDFGLGRYLYVVSLIGTEFTYEQLWSVWYSINMSDVTSRSIPLWKGFQNMQLLAGDLPTPENATGQAKFVYINVNTSQLESATFNINSASFVGDEVSPYTMG